MYSLTFRVRVTTPRSMDEMERPTQQAHRCYRRRGESFKEHMHAKINMAYMMLGLIKRNFKYLNIPTGYSASRRITGVMVET